MVKIWSPDIDIVDQTLTLLDTEISQLPVESVEFIDAVQTGNVASGGTEITEITAPTGYVYELQNLLILVSKDADASSGTHKVEFTDSQRKLRILKGESVFGSSILYQNCHWAVADSDMQPPDDAAGMAGLKGLRADENRGYEFYYKNDLDVAQENDREYYLWVRKIRVA